MDDLDKVFGDYKEKPKSEISIPKGKKLILVDDDEYEGITKADNYYKELIKPQPQPVSYERLYGIVKNWTEGSGGEHIKQFFIASYLFAGRRRETLQLRKMDLEKKEIKGMDFLCAKMVTLKGRGKTNAIRDVICPVGGYEKAMADSFFKYIDNFFDKEKLFEFSDNYAWRALTKLNVGPLQVLMKKNGIQTLVYKDEYPCKPHYLRHCRLTHLVKYYNFSSQDLKKYVDWSSERMADRYVHTQVEDLALKFRDSIKGE